MKRGCVIQRKYSGRRILKTDDTCQTIEFIMETWEWKTFIQKEIYYLKQDTKLVTGFFSDLKILCEELDLYLPMPMCSCRAKCSCETGDKLLHVICFLTGLNENFSVVKSKIFVVDPLPPIDKIFSMVIQQERQGNFSSSANDPHTLLNVVDSKSFGSKFNLLLLSMTLVLYLLW